MIRVTLTLSRRDALKIWTLLGYAKDVRLEAIVAAAIKDAEEKSCLHG